MAWTPRAPRLEYTVADTMRDLSTLVLQAVSGERAAKKGLDPIVANYSTQANLAGDVLTTLVGLGTTIKLSKKYLKKLKMQ